MGTEKQKGQDTLHTKTTNHKRHAFQIKLSASEARGRKHRHRVAKLHFTGVIVSMVLWKCVTSYDTLSCNMNAVIAMLESTTNYTQLL